MKHPCNPRTTAVLFADHVVVKLHRNQKWTWSRNHDDCGHEIFALEHGCVVLRMSQQTFEEYFEAPFWWLEEE